MLGSLGVIQDVRIFTFNPSTGGFLAQQTQATTVMSGMPFEVHALMSPSEKDGVIDFVIRDLRYAQEIPLWSVPNSHIYSLGPEILDITNVRYYTDPTGSLSRSLSDAEGLVSWFGFYTTASGQELRIRPSLAASYQLILDAVLAPSLGAGDLATLHLPSEDWVLQGVAARCFWLLEQRSASTEQSKHKSYRREMANGFTALSRRFQPATTRRIQTEEQM
jgi:hypothetical protein